MITHAYISGTLGQAVIVESEQTLLVQANGGHDFVEPGRNEISFFFSSSREILDFVDQQQKPIERKDVITALDDETRRHAALGYFLTGLDPRFRNETRLKAIGKAELAFKQEEVFKFVAGRVLTTTPLQALDVASAMILANKRGASQASTLLENIAHAGDIELAIDTAFHEANLDRDAETGLRHHLMDDPRMADMVIAYASGDLKYLRNVMFELTQASIERKKALVGIASILAGKLSQSQNGAEVQQLGPSEVTDAPVRPSKAEDPISRMIVDWRDGIDSGRRKTALNVDAVIKKVKGQIDWYMKAIENGRIERAEATLKNLVSMQLRDSRPKDLVKTLSDLAKRTGDISQMLLAFDIIGYAKLLNIDDPAINCTEAELLRKYGKPIKALEIYQATTKQFPNDEVAHCGLAETMRELGRIDEALEIYQATTKQFPNNEVAHCGLAETMRELGRIDEALEIYQATTKQFPNNEVAPNGLAMTLLQLGKYAAVRKTLSRSTAPVSQSDWISEHILAMNELRSGNVDKAIEQLENGIKMIPFAKSKRYFINALAVAKLQKGKSSEAVMLLEENSDSATGRQARNILVFKAHALAVDNKKRLAEQNIKDAENIVSFSEFSARRLKKSLEKRFGLFGDSSLQGDNDDIEALDQEILHDEIILLLAA
ncbi:MAG: tetratricopeptide repeat protein [Hyphomicrobiales bacterium]|nr:tetratricopeptide repeat protein [Hyphomicrobiales bacterium]